MSITSSLIPIVDLFAGPGGLGEGFSALENGKAFQIVVSAEKDPIAHKTLRLRAFYRLLRTHNSDLLVDYYDFCNGKSKKPYSDATEELWELAGEEALCLEIGSEEGNAVLDKAIETNLKKRGNNLPWILIGGPPCQAYSLVGRARNKGNTEYKPEEDHRHFLYKEYLRIIQKYKPSIFVMENVKGILSSKINGKNIYHQIFKDLANPDKALGIPEKNHNYRIVSLVDDQVFKDGNELSDLDAKRYIIKSEEYGIPQARHRVILLGIREDYYQENLPKLTPSPMVSVGDIINHLPILRSKLSKQIDSPKHWAEAVHDELWQLANYAETGNSKEKKLSNPLKEAANIINNSIDTGGTRVLKKKSIKVNVLDDWYKDSRLKVWLNHEARGHRIDDLARYGYAACFAKTYKRSPKGHLDFSLPGLAPAHKNWKSGHFSDRFRVQLADRPATTITSHISKDGHYYIHYDPTQCRSLTVREAARLQTFPDNYFFQGGRTSQYHQVGNAVPPLLANQIANIVKRIISDSENFPFQND